MSSVQIVLVDVDLDGAAFAGAQAALADLCSESASEWVLLLMTETTFVDLRGLDMLLAARERCLSSGRTLVVVGAPHSLVRMVEVLGLHDELLLAEGPLDAVMLMQAADAVNDVLPSSGLLGPGTR